MTKSQKIQKYQKENSKLVRLNNAVKDALEEHRAKHNLRSLDKAVANLLGM